MDKPHNVAVFTPGTLSLAIAAILLPGLSLAQDRVLEEVIVTAQKRAESVQDVPMGVTAISAEALARAGISNTADLVKLSPSLTFAAGDNAQNSGFSIRGVGTSVYSIGVENSVAVVIDDVSTVQAGQALANLVDIERVEVLRGPQSTLFGKSASAGLINVTTKAPAEELEASLELTATDDDETRATASVSGPLTDRLGYRLSGYWSDLDGYYDNLTDNNDINDNNSKGVRGKLRWDITDTVQAELGAYYSKDESTCCQLSWLDLDPDAKVFGIVPGEVAEGITPSDENRDVRRDFYEDAEAETTGVNARFSIELGEFTLTSITAYDNWTYYNVGDVDFSDVDVLGFFTGGALSGGFESVSDVETDFISQELRLKSPMHEKYDYLVGLYYADAETDRDFARNKGLPIIPADWTATAETESMALFGQFNWRFTENTQLTAGLRWNDEEISIDYANQLDPEGGFANGDDSDSEILGNLSLQYYLQEDVMLYARYAQGYKGQAYNVVTGFNQEDADNPVAPETSDSYELGLRSTLWDQRLQINATLFYTEYEDYQAQNTVITPDGDFINKLRNVGEVETQGVELAGAVLVGQNLTVNFGATYLDTEIKSFEGAPCYPGQTESQGCVGGVQNLEGADLPNAPGWKYNLAANYQLELQSMPFYGFFDLSYTWQDDIHFGVTDNPLAVQDSYGIASASFGISERNSDLYQVTLFVNNFTDESYSVATSDIRNLFGGKLALIQNLPRESQRYWGVRVKFNY
jgi:iron complex outermembrane receptor protein